MKNLKKTIRGKLIVVKRKIYNTDEKIKLKYFNKNATKKLHIGGGIHQLEGWLNTDFYPHLPSIMHLDATARFPFANNTFDYIFTEHMIEHITFNNGLKMLHECIRVLRPCGKIRIVTPDINKLMNLFEQTKLNEAYIEWHLKSFFPQYIKKLPGYVINNCFYNFGHKFLYDKFIIKAILEAVGFENIIFPLISKSSDHHLCNLEFVQRMPTGFYELESFAVEASKPTIYNS